MLVSIKCEKASSENKWLDAREYNVNAQITNTIVNLSQVMDHFKSEKNKTMEKVYEMTRLHFHSS